MAKPSVTLRNTKGAALTYSELDTNFTNLKDATLTLTAGSGGTSVTADLNGTITIVAGTNITVSGDNSAKTLTINSTAGGSGTVNSGTAGRLAYYPSNGTTVDDIPLTYSNTLGAVTLVSNSTGGSIYLGSSNDSSSLYLLSSGSAIFNANTDLTLGTGTIKLDDYSGNANGAVLIVRNQSGGDYVGGITIGARFLKMPQRTSTQRNAQSATNGDVIYNTTDNKLQVYANGSWVDLH